MKIVTDRKIAETSSKGNQEKWFEDGRWYKLDQFGYEALSEAVISELLGYCNFNNKFDFVRYNIEELIVHNRPRVACVSDNFLNENQSIITINRLLSNEIGEPLIRQLRSISSNKRRIEYMVDKTKKITGLNQFGEYMTLVFEVDALFLNEDRHLNNIAVIYSSDEYDYCPIFDNGAGLLSDVRSYGLDIEPRGLYSSVKSQPFEMSFTRQINTARKLYGRQLNVGFDMNNVAAVVDRYIEFYPARDRDLIRDRIEFCIKKQLKLFKES